MDEQLMDDDADFEDPQTPDEFAMRTVPSGPSTLVGCVGSSRCPTGRNARPKRRAP